jgi:hypothetical protein
MDVAEFRIVRPPAADLKGALLLSGKLHDPRRSTNSFLTVNNIPKEIGSKDDDPLRRVAKGTSYSPLQGMYELLNATNDYLRRHND